MCDLAGQNDGALYEQPVGASCVFRVEVNKAANAAAADVKDTTELGRQWKPQAPKHGK